MLKNIITKLGLKSDTDPTIIKLVNSGATLIDVRTTREFSGGSAVGSNNIPYNQLKSRLSELKSESAIVVFCRSGFRSGKAKNMLLENNFTNVENGGTWKVIKKIQEKK